MTNGRGHPEALVALLLGALLIAVVVVLVAMGTLLGTPLGYVRGLAGFLAYSGFMALAVYCIGRLGPRYFPDLPVWRSGKWIVWSLLILSLGYRCFP